MADENDFNGILNNLYSVFTWAVCTHGVSVEGFVLESTDSTISALSSVHVLPDSTFWNHTQKSNT